MTAVTDPLANRAQPIPVYGWAREVVGSIHLARTVARWLFVLSAVALGLGVLAAVFTFLGYQAQGSDGFGGSGDWLAMSAVAGSLLSGVLPAGLLAAGGALLRIQAARFETDMLDEGPPGAELAD